MIWGNLSRFSCLSQVGKRHELWSAHSFVSKYGQRRRAEDTNSQNMEECVSFGGTTQSFKDRIVKLLLQRAWTAFEALTGGKTKCMRASIDLGRVWTIKYNWKGAEGKLLRPAVTLVNTLGLLEGTDWKAWAATLLHPLSIQPHSYCWPINVQKKSD